MRTALGVFSVLAVSAFSGAQNIPLAPLRIGDDAPAFKPTSAAKGEYITSLQKGKTYVIEFWATWCVGCIDAMPHFSDLADKYKGKAEFYSINTMNYVEKGTRESLSEHTKKINDWVAKNSDKMRYNSVLDDEKDTIFNEWVIAIGEGYIPFSLIVDDEGKIAWVGHPMGVDKPLTAVLDKTWDTKAFRDEYEKGNEPDREAKAATPKLKGYISSGDLAKTEALIKSAKHKETIFYTALANCLEMNPNLGARLVAKFDVNDGLSADSWYYLCTKLVPKLDDAVLKRNVLKVSENKAKLAKAKEAALEYACRADLLIIAGDKVGAKPWLEKAKKALNQYEPAGLRESIGKFIDDVAKSINN